MYISHETAGETERRLKEVISRATVRVYDGVYCFEEFPLKGYKFNPEALAIVKDDEVWSELVCCSEDGSGTEAFKVFSFHFEERIDNSGFVGWLAGTIKRKIGTGVFVICGQNKNRGGIFDYWGCPAEMADEVVKLVIELRETSVVQLEPGR